MKTKPIPDAAITHKPMMALTQVAVSARLFFLTVSESPEVMNAGWLMIIFGAILALPSAIIAYWLMKKYGSPVENGIRRTFGKTGLKCMLVLSLILFTLETVSLIKILSDTAAYSVYYRIQTWMLILITAVCVIYASLKGGNGIGGAAQIWRRIFPFLILPAVILQKDSIHLRYLTPVFGPGVSIILKNAVHAAVYFSMIPLSFIIETGYSVQSAGSTNEAKPCSILSRYTLCMITVICLVILHSSVFPALPLSGKGNSDYTDIMISNGRIYRSAQLPILIMWFASAFLSCAYMLYSAGRMLGKLFESENGTYVLIPGGIAVMLAFIGHNGYIKGVSVCLAAAICVLWLLMPVFGFIITRIRRKKV